MADESDYLMGPVDAGYCKYESLLDGTLSLADVARMNDYLEIKAENEHRYIEARKAADKK
jgi:hypothetical protein